MPIQIVALVGSWKPSARRGHAWKNVAHHALHRARQSGESVVHAWDVNTTADLSS